MKKSIFILIIAFMSSFFVSCKKDKVAQPVAPIVNHSTGGGTTGTITGHNRIGVSGIDVNNFYMYVGANPQNNGLNDYRYFEQPSIGTPNFRVYHNTNLISGPGNVGGNGISGVSYNGDLLWTNNNPQLSPFAKGDSIVIIFDSLKYNGQNSVSVSFGHTYISNPMSGDRNFWLNDSTVRSSNDRLLHATDTGNPIPGWKVGKGAKFTFIFE